MKASNMKKNKMPKLLHKKLSKRYLDFKGKNQAIV
jgi:hypothetical protein